VISAARRSRSRITTHSTTGASRLQRIHDLFARLAALDHSTRTRQQQSEHGAAIAV
jgi:hypothetical protein